MSATELTPAQKRLADCLQLDGQGRLVQRRDHLNLAGLGLTDDELAAPFDPRQRGLPEISLADLIHLRYLDLTGNALTRLPEGVTGFTGLVWLGLNFNRLEALPEDIGALRQLRRLYLRGNALTALPEGVGELKALLELDLTGCRIPRLPPALAGLEKLEHLASEVEALEPDLRAAWKEKAWASLRGHLARLAQETKQEALPDQFMAKVVLVGPQENGKTCLQRALRGEEFIERHPSTNGMSRERLHLRLNGDFLSPAQRARRPGPREDVMDLTLWDMGGQESYQHTHQMFFTPAAVYLVVTLPRQGGGVQELDRWIELVKRRTRGEGTIIIVSTWCRKFPPDQALSLAELQAKHGDWVRAVMAVDSEDGTGLPELRQRLAGEIKEPRAKCRHTWLRGWAGTLGALAAAPEAFLRWQQVKEMAARHGIREPEELRTLIRTGHYIGALLWREDIPAGEDVVILNPDWLCRAVARLLDDGETRQAHGLVDTHKLARVWRGPGRDGTPGYEPDTYPALVELMEINELAYRPRVAPGQRIGTGDLLLITQMVEDMPRRDVEEEWRKISPTEGAETVRVIAFRKAGGLGYEPVPDLLYLLIFRLREFSLGRTDYTKAVHWQRGLLVTDDYGSAGRIEVEGEKLRVTVRHRLGDGLMHSIVHRVGVRDDGFWSGRGLERAEFVPCGAVCAVGTPDAGLISMEDCAEADREGNEKVRCEACRKYVSISALLRSQRAPVSGDLRNLLTRLEQMENHLALVVRQEGAATRRDMAELGRLVRMQGDGILEAFTSEWKDGPRLFSLLPLPGKAWNPRDWVKMDFQVTIWCEASRRPAPLFREWKDPEDHDKGYRGSEVITLTREWVQGLRRALTLGSWATVALASGGAAGIGGLVAAAGGVIEPSDAKELAAELARQRGVIKELAGALPDEARSPLRGKAGGAEAGGPDGFGSLQHLGFGAPEEADLKLIRHLREEFEKQDPTWGGLVPRDDGKFGRIWAHPRSEG